MALVRIAEVEPLEGRHVRLRLTDGRVIDRDLRPLLHGAVFAELLADEAIFRQVHVEAGTLAWPNGADLCPDVIIWGGPPPVDAGAASSRTGSY